MAEGGFQTLELSEDDRRQLVRDRNRVRRTRAAVLTAILAGALSATVRSSAVRNRKSEGEEPA